MSTAKRRVVITGANRGLGLELARQCVARGDAVWAGCRKPQAATALAALGPASILPLDIADAPSIGAFGRAVAADIEGLDLLINNAGVNATAFGADAAHTGVLELDAALFMAQMQVNAVGPMILSRVLLPLLRKSESAVVANMSSQLGSLALGAQMLRDIGYNASKAALNMITAALAGTLGPEGITVVTIHPGWVKTDMGGPEAPMTPEASARSVLATIAGLETGDNGRFLNWDGATHPW